MYSSNPSINPLSRFGGDIFVAKIDPDTGELGGEYFVGHVPTFTVAAPALETVEERGSNTFNAGQIIYQENISVTTTWSMAPKTFNGLNLALAMYGESAVFSQTAGTDGAAIDVTAHKDAWTKTDKYMWDSATPPVVQNEAETVTYALGTDYEINWTLGAIKAIGATILEGDILKVTRTWLEIADGFGIDANTNIGDRYQIRGLVNNLVTGKYGELIIYKTSIAPAGDISWIDPTTLQELGVTGTMEIKDGMSTPWSFKNLG